MTFDRPELLALAPLSVLAACLAVTAQWRRGMRLLNAFGGRSASGRMTPARLHAFPATRLVALVVAAVSLTLVAAGPQRPEPPAPTERPIDLVVAVDLSLSMTAGDVPGGRAARATEVLAGVMDALPDEHIGVAIFADWPYTLVPVTHDLDVIRFFSGSLGPAAVNDRDQGTGLGAVVTHARAALDERRREETDPIILLLTDGEGFADRQTLLDSVASATAGGVRLWTGGIGTVAGGTMARPDTPADPVLDDRGTPVLSHMDGALLAEMAAAGGGRYHDVTDDAGLAALLDDLAGAERVEPDGEGGPGLPFWITLLALPLLLWEATADSHRVRGRVSRPGPTGADRAPAGRRTRGPRRAPSASVVR